jgi:uncharacterized membrane protein
MAEEFVAPAPDPEDANTDPGNGIVADIESRLQTQFPDLEHRPEVIQTIQTVIRERFMFAGPHPPPQMLAEYERVCPGWATRILEQGEREQLARIDREQEELAQTRFILQMEADDKRSGRTIEMRGQVFGFLAFLVIAAIGAWALYRGQTAVAITCFTTFVLGVVGMFITGRRKNAEPKER